MSWCIAGYGPLQINAGLCTCCVSHSCLEMMARLSGTVSGHFGMCGFIICLSIPSFLRNRRAAGVARRSCVCQYAAAWRAKVSLHVRTRLSGVGLNILLGLVMARVAQIVVTGHSCLNCIQASIVICVVAACASVCSLRPSMRVLTGLSRLSCARVLCFLVVCGF